MEDEGQAVWAMERAQNHRMPDLNAAEIKLMKSRNSYENAQERVEHVADKLRLLARL